MAAKISSDMEKALAIWEKSGMTPWEVAKQTNVSYQGLMSALKATGRIKEKKSSLVVKRGLTR